MEIPIISRARAYRLYDYKGNRIIDMYQNMGYSILGHRGNKITKIMKNVISRGQIFDLPSKYTKRLENALAKFFPQYKSFRIYSNIKNALDVMVEYLNEKIQINDIADPALSFINPNSSLVSYWRPFLSPETEKTSLYSRIMIPIVPFSVGGVPQILCFKEKIDDSLFPSNTISPFILAGTIRSLYDLKKFLMPNWKLDQYIDKSNWAINNLYISTQLDINQYRQIYKYFLKNNVLLAPAITNPSIIPLELSLNEVKKIQQLFLNCMGVL